MSSNELDLDFSPLGKALGQFEIALRAHEEKPEDDFIRDAVIQRFEFTYELAVKSLRRYLVEAALSEVEIDELTFQDIIRRGDMAGVLLNGWPRWNDYKKARNETVHTYSELRAIKVVGTAKEFAVEARVLYENLMRRANGGV